MEKGTSEYAEDWTSENNLINHFNKHGRSMGYKTINEYAKGARNTARNSNNLSGRTKDGKTIVYDPDSNEIVIINGSGRTITYFSPDRGINYYYDQFD